MTKLRAVLKRRWFILVGLTLAGVVAGVLSTQFVTQGKSKLFSASQVVVANAGSPATASVSQDALKFTRGAVPKLAAERLGSPEDSVKLASQIGAVYDPKTASITVTASNKDGAIAAKRTSVFVDAFLEIRNGELQSADRKRLAQMSDDLKGAEDELAKFDLENPQISQPGFRVEPGDLYTINLINSRINLKTRIKEFQDDKRALELDLLRNLPYAALGPEPPRLADSGLIDVPASRVARAALVGFLGFLLGAALVMLVERVSRRIDTRDELVEITDLPILAEIGFLKDRNRPIDKDGRVALTGVWAEPYRRVRSAVQFVQVNAATSNGWIPQPGTPSQISDSPPSVFLVTSTSPAEGKSTTAALVSMALAEVGVPTVLLGGDFRKPRVEVLLGAKPSPSLREMALLDVDRPTVDDVAQQSSHDNLYVVAAGAPSREVVGLVDAAKRVCAEAVSRGATVIIDSSPLQAANDTLDLLPCVDFVILVLRVGRSSETDLLDTIATLRRMESRILGIVLIGTDAARRQEYYYDYYSGAQTTAPMQQAQPSDAP